MSGFWDKKSIKEQKNVVYTEGVDEPMILDELAVAQIQEEQYDVFEDDEEDTSSIMHDANLRLEQGRLYQMVLQGDIFADTNADPKAIKNVQREIRKYVRERMETMLGIRQEQAVETVVSSPFNDLEVTALKMLASRVSGGATEKVVKEGPELPPAPPKKDGITSISGSLRPQTTPLRKEVKPLQKSNPLKKSNPKSAIKEEESNLKKPIEEMTPEELAAHDKAALERRSRNYAAMPNNLVPHPSPQALEMLYTQQVAQNPAPGSAVARMTDLINGRK
jgi:hypothetical protein